MTAERGAFPEVLGLEDEYEIIAELGRGGSAVVYRARDRSLGRDVAIKVVRGQARTDDEQLARLAREARTVAQLDHPRIVRVYAVRQLPDGLALVMQWIPGRTLKQRIIEEGPLPAAHALAVLHDVAAALGAAHQRGIVHRDVKPENIFLDAHRNVAMLSDFGIAISAEYDTRLTMTGTAIGTPTYMAPELLDGGLPTPRSDVYALGLVAWEMLTGCQPWSGESLYGVIYKQKHDQLPSLDGFRDDVPDTTQYVIERALQKRANARWASGDGMLAQLQGSVLPADWSAWQAARARRVAERERVTHGSPRDPALGGKIPTDRTAEATRRFRRGETSADASPVAAPSTEQGRSHEKVTAVGSTAIPDDVPDWVLEDTARQHAGIADDLVTRRVWPWAVAAALMVAAIGVFFAYVNTSPFRPAASATMASDVRIESRAEELPLLRTSPSADVAQQADTVRMQVAKDRAATDSGVTDVESDGRLESWPSTVEARPIAPRIASRAKVVTSARAAPTPLPPSIPRTAVDVVGAHILTAGGRHSCVITRSRVTCWGANEDGQLGNGSGDAEVVPVAVRGELAFVSLSAGLAHTCGVVRGGAVYCWGNGDAGQLGDATTTSRSAPVRVASSLDFAVVRAGRDHSCALTNSGAVACWGRNTKGQLGDGTAVGRSSPVMVRGAGRYHAIAAGAAHSCALTVDGAAFCWGANEAGQLGDGSVQTRPQPTAVASSLRFADIAAGNAHTCAVSLAGDVWCWGRINGAVRTSPVRVVGPSRIQSVTAGAVHSCARNIAGSVWCWGGNEYGQVGIGTTSANALPQLVSARRFDAVVASGAHSCALAGREVWCWGYNADGQVGAGAGGESGDSAVAGASVTVVTRPTRVPALEGGAR